MVSKREWTAMETRMRQHYERCHVEGCQACQNWEQYALLEARRKRSAGTATRLTMTVLLILVAICVLQAFWR
jgi:hypothetical protein